MAYTKEKILKKQREYQRKYRKNNKEKIKKSVFVYSNSEKGYFVGLWNVIKRRKITVGDYYIVRYTE